MKPGEFPIGSVESRAAARRQLEQKKQLDDPFNAELMIITNVNVYHSDPPGSFKQYKLPDGSIVRVPKCHTGEEGGSKFVTIVSYDGPGKLPSLAELKALVGQIAG